ncbi:MAG: hypothetical protein DHS20C14_19830 [Phycisphaeraceae bacterium]|nr:MAG: hypothetical protein DHS20C14_19830 [Phycisphaeraceae bacterium]
MGVTIALDELYETGWSALDTTGCEADDDGRWYPSVAMVAREFEAAGFAFAVSHVQLFECYRAAWTDESGSPAGAVVGASEAEAAVYALSRLRRALASA